MGLFGGNKRNDGAGDATYTVKVSCGVPPQEMLCIKSKHCQSVNLHVIRQAFDYIPGGCHTSSPRSSTKLGKKKSNHFHYSAERACHGEAQICLVNLKSRDLSIQSTKPMSLAEGVFQQNFVHLQCVPSVCLACICTKVKKQQTFCGLDNWLLDCKLLHALGFAYLSCFDQGNKKFKEQPLGHKHFASIKRHGTKASVEAQAVGYSLTIRLPCTALH